MRLMLHKSGAKLALKSVMAKRNATKHLLECFFLKYFAVSFIMSNFNPSRSLGRRMFVF